MRLSRRVSTQIRNSIGASHPDSILGENDYLRVLPMLLPPPTLIQFQNFGTVNGYVNQARATLHAKNAIFYTPSERELIRWDEKVDPDQC
jgi:hypothetical protein